MEIKSEISKEVITKIAKACHQANLAYCVCMGDHSQVRWDEAPEDIKNSAVVGVMHHLMNPEITPEESHEVWMEFKAKEGWVYGPTKDAGHKTHPCMVPYEQLPVAQRAKDYLFKATVDNCREIMGV